MDEQGKKEVTAVKMHRLRRALGRLRNMRSGETPRRKKSWLDRLKARLGLSDHADEE